jgi:hypothetical protein
MSEQTDDRAIVTTLLGEAALPASPDEIASLARVYRKLRAGIESLYAVADARYESPCLNFDPNPTFADWWLRKETAP